LNKSILIDKVNFKREFPDRLAVSIDEKKPVAIFKEDENYFFIDKKGIIFEKNLRRNLEKSSWPVIKNPNLGGDLKLGDKIIGEKKLSQILEINSGLKKLDIEITVTEIANDQRVNVKTSEGWDVYFDLGNNNVSQQIFNLGLVLKEKIFPEDRENLEYIDLRFGNRVYYK